MGLGRLILTPEKRLELDISRRQTRSNLALQGMLSRSDGLKVFWLNHKAYVAASLAEAQAIAVQQYRRPDQGKDKAKQ